jgi:hypothetical protein
VPEGRACGNCHFYDESNVQGDKAWCERWDEYVNGAYYCNAWQPHEDDDADEQEAGYRAVDLMLPEYIMEAAAARDWSITRLDCLAMVLSIARSARLACWLTGKCLKTR